MALLLRHQVNINSFSFKNTLRDCKYMKIIYVPCSWRNKYRSNPCSYENYWTSSWNEAWKNWILCTILASVDISADTSADISVDYRPTIGRLSVNSRPIYRPIADSKFAHIGRCIGRQSVDISVDYRSTIGQLSVDYRPIVGRLSTDSRPINVHISGDALVDHRSIYRSIVGLYVDRGHL